ncbi:MAG: hypothetical protein J6W47_00555 [Bacteroidales bacterium]|nr:hypothetical protein [Bacteroidales bacterium]
MNKSFNINRFAALLRYDWMLGKNTLMLTIGITLIIYVVVFVLYFLMKGILAPAMDTLSTFPLLVAASINSFFQYGLYAVVFAVTTLFTMKFCNPKTSTTYLALPGSTLEKFSVVIADYLIAFGAYTLIYLVVFYATMGIGFLLFPDLDWAMNGLAMLDPQYSYQRFSDIFTDNKENMDKLYEQMPLMAAEMDSFINGMMYWSIPSNFGTLAIYLVCNMLFRTNCQLKSIGVFVLGYLALTIVFVIWAVTYVITDAKANADIAVVDQDMSVIMHACKFWIVGLTVIGLSFYAILYRQIARKQAK